MGRSQGGVQEKGATVQCKGGLWWEALTLAWLNQDIVQLLHWLGAGSGPRCVRRGTSCQQPGVGVRI